MNFFVLEVYFVPPKFVVFLYFSAKLFPNSSQLIPGREEQAFVCC